MLSLILKLMNLTSVFTNSEILMSEIHIDAIKLQPRS